MGGEVIMAKRTTFTAKSMFAELKGGPKYALTGMVKEHDTDKSIVLFASIGDCSKWTPVEEKLIESYEVAGSAACGDHSHPVVTLHLLQPAAPEAQVFAQATLRGPTLSPFASVASRRLGAGTDCVWDDTYKVWRHPQTWEICVNR